MYALKGKFRKVFVSLLTPGLSRFARRWRAFAMRLPLDYVHVPRHCGTLAVLGFFSVTAVYGAVAGGHWDPVFNAVSSSAGFSVERVEVSGNTRVSEIDVLSVLGLDEEVSLIGFDAAAARTSVAALPWVASATVQKIYPDRVKVAIVEREPFAVWQHDGVMDIIDRQGRVIMPYRSGVAEKLSLVVGHGAERQAAAFFEEIGAFPAIRDRVQAYIWVGGRRWDLLLDNGVRVKLPVSGVGERLKAALAVEKSDGLFSRDVQSVDLRLDDRITVALSDEAMARRDSALKEALRRQKAGRI